MAFENMSFSYIVPVSVNGRIIDIFIDPATPEDKDVVKKILANFGTVKKVYANKAEEDACLLIICKRSTEILSEYCPEFKEALNGKFITDPWAWIAFEKARQRCVLEIMRNPFSGKSYRYNGVVKLI